MKRRDALKAGGLVALGLLAGCGKKSGAANVVTNFTLTSQEVVNFMSDKCPTSYQYSVRDAKYSLPARSYIEGGFSTALKSFLFQLNSNEWKTEENDCDDFAVAAFFLMSFLHHNTAHKVSQTGLAFGEFHYMRADGQGHAINVAIAREGEKLSLVFYEPQTYSIVELSKEEIESCVFWRF